MKPAKLFAALYDAERYTAAADLAALDERGLRMICEHVARRHDVPPGLILSLLTKKREGVEQARAALANAPKSEAVADAAPEAAPIE